MKEVKAEYIFYVIGIIFLFATIAYFSYEYLFSLSNLAKTVILICLVALFIVLMPIAFLSQKAKAQPCQGKKLMSGYFRRVKQFIIDNENFHWTTPVKAIIYEDTKTGVKYLYIWSGAGNGGPAICRYWEKK